MGRTMKSQLPQSNTHDITNTGMADTVRNPPTSQAMKKSNRLFHATNSFALSTATKGYLHNQTGCGTKKSSDQSTSQVRSYLGTSVFFFLNKGGIAFKDYTDAYFWPVCDRS
jgi:hypothetical protein